VRLFPDNRLAARSARLFRPLRALVGPLHRSRPAISHERQMEEERLIAPPAAWWASDPRWYPADFPPRLHNRVTPLVHGEAYFTALHEALLQARHYVYIAGWCLTPFFPLQRGNIETMQASQLARVLDQVSRRADVRVLLWAGAPLLFEPTMSHVTEERQQLLEAAPQVRCALDERAHFSHCHHQKAVVIDGQVGFIGGMDITSFQGDRWDTARHEPRWGPNWHDVQLRIEGEAVTDLEENFRQRWADATGETELPHCTPSYDDSWHVPTQIIRTVPADFYTFAPQGIYGIRHAYLKAIEAAESFIYLENQYLWAPEIVDALIAAMNRPHSGQFRIVLVLPAKAYTGKYDNDQHVKRLREADGGRGIFEAYALYTGGMSASVIGYRYLPVYVHAKVGIIDDQWLSVGSANLNRRGLANDTEMNAQIIDPTQAKALRVTLWAEHLGISEGDVQAADPIALIDSLWKERAAEMAHAIASRVDLPHGNIIRYDTGKMPGSTALDELQNLTLEF
jgi:phosphatidylserine/phosphatidylglycerophosphate/cardiolipin synthase-like enzyme